MPRNRLVPLCVVGAVLITSVALAGCVEQAVPLEPKPVPSASASDSPSVPAIPVFDPDGTAESNRDYFDATNAATIAAVGGPGGRDFIDGLVAAGFDKSTMEVTADATAIGLQADNVQFSVRFDDACVIGQYGNVGYASTVQPTLSTGKCFIGTTRPITW